jgi:rhamnosyltransferase
MKLNLAGIIVLYNPNEAVLTSINSYINEINKLYVVDNSENVNVKVIEDIKKIYKVHYIYMNGNRGIAKALNVGAEKALEEGYTWLLTMDQDSIATPNMVRNMINFINSKDTSKIGIISPFHEMKDYLIPKRNAIYEEVLVVMTSGNMLNLNIYKRAGGFMDELFIDCIDGEYCLRLNYMGFKVIQINNAILEHNLGESRRFHFFNKIRGKTLINNYNYIRRYYIARNTFFMLNKYKKIFPHFAKKHFYYFIRDLIKMIIFDDYKIRKIRMTFKGYFDYKKGKFGKLC